MKTLDDIRDACRIDDETGCWEWTGAVDRGLPRIYAPDFSRCKGGMRVQVGRRALWHIVNQKALPRGWRVYGDPAVCTSLTCMNPEHLKAGSIASWGRDRAKAGHLKGNIKLHAHLRKQGRRRSVLTPETYAEILTSTESGAALARRLNISNDTVSKARRGKIKCFQAIGGLFSGLLKGAA